MMNGTIQHVTSVFTIDQKTLMGENRRQRRRSIIRNFALNTSTHGLPGIARSESVHNRVFWSLSTLIFTGVMLYFVTQSIRDYFDYPTQTSVDVTIEWPIPFPAFTFCNYSPSRRDRFVTAFADYLNLLKLNITNDTNLMLSQYINLVGDFFRTQINENRSVSDLLFPLEAMLIRCRFNNFACNSSDFISFESPVYGRCYTFNAKMKGLTNGGVRDSNANGGNGALDLHFYLHSHQYIPYLTDGFILILD